MAGPAGAVVAFGHGRRARPPSSSAAARRFDGSGQRFGIEADVLAARDGVVAAIGLDLDAPEGARVIDATGRWVALLR
ncbi:MAG: hypothetical protein R2711_15535 [Acidimicrobiales bacterium]